MPALGPQKSQNWLYAYTPILLKRKERAFTPMKPATLDRTSNDSPYRKSLAAKASTEFDPTRIICTFICFLDMMIFFFHFSSSHSSQ
jgi:hypothetical protein